MIMVRILNKEPLYDYREACKLTEGKLADYGWTPAEETEYWIKQICANHSTLRSIKFRLTAIAPKSVIMQIIRATKGHPQPEVQSSRPDWTGEERSNDPYEEKLFCQDHTAESFVEMAKQRLCNRTEAKTRAFMNEVVEYLKLPDNPPFLQAVGWCCHPACEWLGNRCPELKSCGYRSQKISDLIINEYKHKGL